MNAELKQRLQVVLAFAVIIAGIRVAYIFYERHETKIEPAKNQPALMDVDYYVNPKKLHPHDLQSAQELTKQPVWVKVGYANSYFTYDATANRVGFRPVGTLLPLQKLQITNVITVASPQAANERRVMAVFQKQEMTYAFAIGTEKDGDFKIYSDDMLFIEDPHELYKHWPSDIWQSIDQHQAKVGMNEFQAGFALGMGIPQGGGNFGERIVRYPNNGNPLTVDYHDGKAKTITSGQ